MDDPHGSALLIWWLAGFYSFSGLVWEGVENYKHVIVWPIIIALIGLGFWFAVPISAFIENYGDYLMIISSLLGAIFLTITINVLLTINSGKFKKIRKWVNIALILIYAGGCYNIVQKSGINYDNLFSILFSAGIFIGWVMFEGAAFFSKKYYLFGLDKLQL